MSALLILAVAVLGDLAALRWGAEQRGTRNGGASPPDAGLAPGRAGHVGPAVGAGPGDR